MLRQNIQSTTINVLLILLSGAVFVWTADMTPGAELFPRIMAGGLAVFGGVELILEFLKMRKSNQEKSELQVTDPALIKKSIIFMGSFFLLIVLFFISLPFLGFAVVSTVFMMISMMLIGGKKALRKWPIALIVPGFIILVFQYGLKVRLPGLGIF